MGNSPTNFTDPLGLGAKPAAVMSVPQSTYAGGRVGMCHSATQSFSSPISLGTLADIGVGFTPAGVAADIYSAVTGQTIFGGETLSGLERAAILIPGVSEIRGLVGFLIQFLIPR